MEARKMKSLIFEYNWNNKLNCKSFIAVRETELQEGEEVKISLQKNKKLLPVVMGIARVLRKTKLKVGNAQEMIPQLDSGYSLQEWKGIIEKMYHIKPGMVDSFELNLYLLRYINITQSWLT